MLNLSPAWVVLPVGHIQCMLLSKTICIMVLKVTQQPKWLHVCTHADGMCTLPCHGVCNTQTPLQVPIMFPLSDRQLWQLARLLQPKTFAKGQMVFHQGDEADNFYICQRGAFSCFTSECRLCSSRCDC